MKRQEKKDIIQKHQAHAKDTGSTKVQVAILTESINRLTEHLQEHKKDTHSRRGLYLMVGKRRKLLKYMKDNSPKQYEETIQELGLRK